MFKGGMAGLMKQAQTMQDNLKRAQEKLGEELAIHEVVGVAASGAVKVTMTCRHVVRSVKVDPSVFEDAEMAEDLIAAAFNDAARQADQVIKERTASLASGFPLPPGMDQLLGGL
ncbi:MAG: YbaB/EbfC family nucleoid-associated protein [Pseudomonadota bacterium]